MWFNFVQLILWPERIDFGKFICSSQYNGHFWVLVCHVCIYVFFQVNFSLFPPPTQAAEGDVFAADPGSKKKTKPKAIFAGEGSKNKTKPKGTKKAATNKEKRKKPKAQSDEDLFGNTDYIFGDLPAAAKTKPPKTKKKKKKVEQF